MREMCAAELRRRPTRELYEHARVQPGAPLSALIARAYKADFASDRKRDLFGGSKTPRTTRPAGMRFRVGDCYIHGKSKPP